MRKQIFFIALLLFASVLSINAVRADEILGCVNITSSGVYILNTSITDWAGEGACINITSNDVEIDCQGGNNWIDGRDTSDTVGIKAEGLSTAKLTNITIKNCNVTDWSYGIYFWYIENSTLSNIRTSSNSQHGIYLSSSSYNNLSNINTSGNSGGIFFVSSSYNNLSHINASGNSGISIYLEESDSNIIRNASIIRNAGQGGLYVFGSSISSHMNNIDTSNTVNGKPIQYFDGIMRACPNNEILDYNNTYSHLSLIGCNNATVNMTTDDMIYLYSTNNSRIVDSNSSNSHFGIILHSSSYNNLSNINTLNNSQHGIYLYTSSNNTLTSINASGNSFYGIFLWSSSYNNLSNINTSGNSGGIFFVSSSYNNLMSINASGNSLFGIIISSSSNNNLTNITASNDNQTGIWLDSSFNNQIINSTIKDNKRHGLYLSYSRFNNITGTRIENNSVSGYAGIYIGSDASDANANSSYNRFWNNIINNTPNGGSNLVTYGPNYTNYFNTTKIAGTNIIGGAWISGNYWSDYNRTSGSGDGIGDPYVINESLMNDSLPLIDPYATTPLIAIISPLNQTYSTSQPSILIGLNISLNVNGSLCAYSINGSNIISMAADSNLKKWNSTINVSAGGTYYIQYYCNNTAGKINSTGTKIHFYIGGSGSDSQGGSSGGGGSGGAKTYDAGTLTASITQELSAGDKIKFIFNNSNHTITLVGIASTRAAVQIKTTTAILTKNLDLNQSQALDIDDDGTLDIEIIVRNITMGATPKAKVEVKPLVTVVPSAHSEPQQNITTPPIQPPQTPPATESVNKGDEKVVIKVILLVAIAAILTTVIFLIIRLIKII